MTVRRRLALLVTLGALAVPSAAGAQTITEFPIDAGANPRYVQPGPDGAMWFTAGAGIGRMATSGALLGITPDGIDPVDLLVAPDGVMYWTGELGVRRRNPDGLLSPIATEFPLAHGIGLDQFGRLRVGIAGFEGPEVCGLFGVWGSTPSCGGVDDYTLLPGGRGGAGQRPVGGA